MANQPGTTTIALDENARNIAKIAAVHSKTSLRAYIERLIAFAALPLDVYEKAEKAAYQKGVSVQDYLKGLIEKGE